MRRAHHPVRRFFRTAVFSPPRWSARQSSDQNGWRRRAAGDGRYRGRRRRAGPVFAKAAPTPPAAQVFREMRESREYRAWWWRRAPPDTPPAQAQARSAAPSQPGSLPLPAQTRHPRRRSTPAGRDPVDPLARPTRLTVVVGYVARLNPYGLSPIDDRVWKDDAPPQQRRPHAAGRHPDGCRDQG